jgi:hypothetical protein
MPSVLAKAASAMSAEGASGVPPVIERLATALRPPPDMTIARWNNPSAAGEVSK